MGLVWLLSVIEGNRRHGCGSLGFQEWALLGVYCVCLCVSGENRSEDDDDPGWPHAHRGGQTPENHWGSLQGPGETGGLTNVIQGNYCQAAA
jgi:hypothetical protein